MVPPIIAITEALRNEHLRQVDQVVKRLIEAYGMLYRKLGAQQAALVAELETLAEGGAGKRAYLRRVEALLQQIEAEVGRYAIYADQEIQRAAREAIDLGLKHAAREVQLSFPQWAQARIMGAFNRLPVAAIEAMLGFLGDQSPLHTSLVDQFGREVAKRIGDKLVEGIALGYNPRKVAYARTRGVGRGVDLVDDDGAHGAAVGLPRGAAGLGRGQQPHRPGLGVGGGQGLTSMSLVLGDGRHGAPARGGAQ